MGTTSFAGVPYAPKKVLKQSFQVKNSKAVTARTYLVMPATAVVRNLSQISFVDEDRSDNGWQRRPQKGDKACRLVIKAGRQTVLLVACAVFDHFMYLAGFC